MVKITINNILPIDIPANGYIVGYRVLGSTGAYTIPAAFTALPIEITTNDAAGTLYEGYVQRDCGTATPSALYFFQTSCNCTDQTYTLSAGGLRCEKTTVIPATVTNSGFCLAPSANVVYSTFGTRIYNPGFTATDVNSAPATLSAGIYRYVTTPSQWKNDTSSIAIGPMNRDGVWVDSDCDGVKDSLMQGAKTTLSFTYDNPGPAKTIYVGAAGDNKFDIVVNGVAIVSSLSGPDTSFKFWHVMPIDINSGLNYINLVATGDGSNTDAVAMVVYNNTADEIAAATCTETTFDIGLDVLFRSSSLNGTSYDTATCPTDYSLDTTAGAGSYVCRHTDYKPCNSIS